MSLLSSVINLYGDFQDKVSPIILGIHGTLWPTPEHLLRALGPCWEVAYNVNRDRERIESPEDFDLTQIGHRIEFWPFSFWCDLVCRLG